MSSQPCAAPAGPSAEARKRPGFWLPLAAFLIGAAVQGAGVHWPVHELSWRYWDNASIARNFYREGMNPLYPRVDWGGDGPGFVEMEFPFLPWTMALVYQGTGVDERVGRAVSFTVSLLTMAVFLCLAADRLSSVGAFAAGLCFALNPIVTELSVALRPEPWMFLGYVVAVRFFARWLQEGRPRDYLVALAATTFAILAKAPAAHVGLLFLALVLERWGPAAFQDRRLWVFACVSLMVPLLWYVHAYRLWLEYGNSLGVSNQSHWLGLDLLRHPAFLRGILGIEISRVWMFSGLATVGLGLVYVRPRSALRLEYWWLLALGVYYVMTARTTGAYWASYYHVVSVPVFALLMGMAAEGLWQECRRHRTLASSIFGLTVLAIVAGWLAYPSLAEEASWPASSAALPLAALAMILAFVARARGPARPWSTSLRALTLACWVVLVSLTIADSVRRTSWLLRPPPPSPLKECAESFARHVPEGSLILASGGDCTDAAGGPTAYNAPYMFYWMDRKGFNICTQEQSVDTVKSYIPRGATFYVPNKWSLDLMPGLEGKLRNAFRVISECDSAILISLKDKT